MARNVREKGSSGVDGATKEDPSPASETAANLRRFANEGFLCDQHNAGLDVHAISLGRPEIASLEFVQTSHHPNAPMSVRRLGVDPHYQRRGIASLLLLSAVQWNLRDIDPTVKTVSIHPGDIALAGVMQKVFGAGNVTWRGAALEGGVVEPIDRSADAGGRHHINDLAAEIDTDRILSISIDEKLRELAQTGHVALF